MTVAFWSSLLLIGFTYAGYPAVMAMLATLRARPVHAAPQTPTVDVLLVVHDAAEHISAKLKTLDALDYPRSQLRITVICDGCGDTTESIARAFPSDRVRVFAHPLRRGKSACIGSALAQLDAELVLFTDVRQQLDPQAARMLAECMADPAVGAVSGELVLEAQTGYGRGIDAYWRFEKMIRRFESASGSLVGVTGALYVARRSLLPSIPEGIVLDDMWIPLHIVAGGHRVVFEPRALAFDRASKDAAEEERRKRRTLAGNFQLLHRWPALAMPGCHPLALRLWGHKWLRLLAPWLLLFVLGANVALSLGGSRVYLLLLALQCAGYLMAATGRAWPSMAGRVLPIRIASAFVSLNASAMLALLDYLRNPRAHLWQTSAMQESAR